jgi:hypothetical protein
MGWKVQGLNPGRGKKPFFSPKVQFGSKDNHTLRCTGVLSQTYDMWDLKLTIHFHLPLKFRMSGAIPILPLYAFWCGQESFTFFTYNSKRVDD